MYKQYLYKIDLVSEAAEIGFIKNQQRTCFNGIYPFKIFPDKELRSVNFEPITIFYGGNGSGKSTLLNIIAEKIGAKRHSDFNGSPFFADYVERCALSAKALPREREILTSDDVFDYLFDVRSLNNGIDTRRGELFDEYIEIKKSKFSENLFTSLDDYDEWKEMHDTKRKSQSQYVRERLAKNVDMHSNGENAMKYFTDHIDENAIYLLDEPENSLSIAYIQDLAKYISDSARYYGCQFIIATHSPILLAIEDALIYDLDDCPVRTKGWTELENVRRYFEFFEEHREEFR